MRTGNGPADSPVRSIRRMSATPRLAPVRWPMDPAPPAPRTVRAHRHRADNLLPLHSTASAPDGARPHPVTANGPLPDLQHPRPPSHSTDAANAPSTASASHARTTLWHSSNCRGSRPCFRPMTTPDRTVHSSVQCPIRWLRGCQDPTRPVVCFARRTSPGTTVHAPDCAAAAPIPPPVRTEYPDAPVPAGHVPSPMPAVAPTSASQTVLPATPAC